MSHRPKDLAQEKEEGGCSSMEEQVPAKYPVPSSSLGSPASSFIFPRPSREDKAAAIDLFEQILASNVAEIANLWMLGMDEEVASRLHDFKRQALRDAQREVA